MTLLSADLNQILFHRKRFEQAEISTQQKELVR